MKVNGALSATTASVLRRQLWPVECWDLLGRGFHLTVCVLGEWRKRGRERGGGGWEGEERELSVV